MKKTNILNTWKSLRAESPVDESPRQCFCVGPQNGEPLCPCAMRFVTIEDGRYIQVIDHGPVEKHLLLEHNFTTNPKAKKMPNYDKIVEHWPLED